jgi:hypothetical protein
LRKRENYYPAMAQNKPGGCQAANGLEKAKFLVSVLEAQG